jgi:ribosomal subunit interface protein
MDITEIIITGHNITGSDRYRAHLAAELAALAHLNPNAIRYDVEFGHEPNPRQSKSAQRVVITSHGTGPAVRVEACGADLPAVLDEAISKLAGRLRRNHDRRVHRRSRPRRTTIGSGTA